MDAKPYFLATRCKETYSYSPVSSGKGKGEKNQTITPLACKQTSLVSVAFFSTYKLEFRKKFHEPLNQNQGAKMGLKEKFQQ